MGQKESCLSAAENAESSRRRHHLVAHQPLRPSPQFTAVKETSHDQTSFRPETTKATKTTTTDANSEEELPDHDRNHGYNLVDLKGDRLLHTEPRTLQGCEVSTPLFCFSPDDRESIHLCFMCQDLCSWDRHRTGRGICRTDEVQLSLQGPGESRLLYSSRLQLVATHKPCVCGRWRTDATWWWRCGGARPSTPLWPRISTRGSS